MSNSIDVFVPLSAVLDQEIWPIDAFGSLDGTFLDDIAYEDGEFVVDDVAFTRSGRLALRVVVEQAFDLAFGLAVVVGAGPVDVFLNETLAGFVVTVASDLIGLRLPRNLFIPAIANGSTFEPDPDPTHFVSIHLPLVVTVHENFDVTLGFPVIEEEPRISLEDLIDSADPDAENTGNAEPDDDTGVAGLAPGFQPTRFFLGNTGISVLVENVILRLSADDPLPPEAFAADLDDSFRGLFIGEAGVFLPPDLASALPDALLIENAFIGTGGFSGTVSLQKTVSGSLAGADFTAKELDIVFVQNALTKFELKGSLRLPFFDDFVDVVVGVDLDGKITVQVSEAGGLVVLEKANVFKFTVDKIELDIQDGLLTVHTSGTLTPQFQTAGPIKWPGIRINDLAIDSEGHVKIAGGWIDLADQVTLNLFGFILEITRIGFGKTDAGKNWIGFNGALRIMEGVPAGASVEGLRILWDDSGEVELTMEGVGVDLTIPDVLEIHGKVSFANKEFAGAVLVTLPAVSMTMQGQFVSGTLDSGEKSYAVFLDLELPVGIPLGPTGLAMYGFSGLFAHNREPNKSADEGWYRNPDFSDGWFTRPTEGITDIATKWRGSVGHMGFGAGVTFGTFGDNGYVFNGRVLLALIFPGPVILLDGMANLFRKRASLLSSEPEFHALMVIDPSKSITVGLDAHYKFKSQGELLDVGGSAEAFFDFVSPSNWHIYLGIKDPASRRLRARAFQMFDVNAFFMLTGHDLAIGAGWSYSKTWGFKHLNVSLSASMFGEATVSWHPNHFSGSIGVSGSAGLHAFGIGIGVSVSATVSGDVFEPFALSGKFSVGIDLPWPLPDVSASVTLEWKQTLSSAPALPVPLREASIEHPKSANTWPIPRGSALISDDGGGQFDFERPGDQAPTTPADLAPPLSADVPKVPADTKVGLTFTRPIDDPSLIGNANSAQVSAEIIGDPAKGTAAYTAGYTLVSLDLQKWAPTKESSDPGFAWVTIQTAGPSNTTTSSDRLIGAWQPGVEQPDAGNSQQNKLLINATSPFDYVADRSQSWTTWFTGANVGYPCPLIDPRLSARFTQEVGAQLGADGVNFFQFDIPHFGISWAYGGEIVGSDAVVNSVLGPALGTIDRGLDLQEGVAVIPPPGSKTVLLAIGNPAPVPNASSSFAGLPLSQPNPLALGDTMLRNFDGTGTSKTLRASNTLVTLSADPRDEALLLGDWLEIEPQVSGASAVYVEVELRVVSAFGFPLEVVVVKPDGTEGTPQQVPPGTSVIRVHQPIGKVVIRRHLSVPLTSAALRRISLRSPVTALARFSQGPSSNFVEENGLITVVGEKIDSILLSAQNGADFLLLELALPSRAEAIVQSTQDSLAQLTKEEPLFEPENDYRVVITTVRDDESAGAANHDVLSHTNTFVDHAYFHVVGPAGIGTPQLPPQTQAGATGFEDLRMYVDQTVPPTIPGDDGKLLLPRAFYRAYDVAVKFNEAYVELMYLRAKRDLTVRLFDGDNNPVLRPDGRVAIPTPSWERSRTQTVKNSVSLWLGMVNQGPCRPDDLPPFLSGSVIKPQILSGMDDVLLAPGALHQARLVPALLHETFVDSLPGLVADGAGHRLERWVVEGVGGDSPRWEVQSETVAGQTLPDGSPAQVFFVAETSGSESSLRYAGALGASDGQDAPGQWSDFRARALVRWSAGVIGLEVRRSSATDLLRVTLDRTSGARTLLALSGGNSTVLASDVGTFPQAATDVEIVIECTADRVRVFVDDDSVGATPIFEVTGAPTAPGTLALFASGAPNARFAEVRVDDLRAQPSAGFVFDFVSSQYANFFHHMHSFDDHLFDSAPVTALTAADLSAHRAPSIFVAGTGVVTPAQGMGTVSDDERRAYEALEAIAFGAGPLPAPERIELTRVSGNGQPLALLLRSPEPLLWERVLLLAASASQPLALTVPGDILLAEVAFGATPAEQAVTILVRNAASLAGHAVDWRPLPSQSNTDPEWAAYYSFGQRDSFPDGRQVRIVGGVAAAVAVEPGIEIRFAADAAVHFLAPGIELRLSAPDGTLVHQRPFLAPTALTPFPLRAVRKLDGTGAVLFVDPNAPTATPGTLRLQFTFSRSAGDPDLQMREDGSETPEVANLDIPIAPVV